MAAELTEFTATLGPCAMSAGVSSRSMGGGSNLSRMDPRAAPFARSGVQCGLHCRFVASFPETEPRAWPGRSRPLGLIENGGEACSIPRSRFVAFADSTCCSIRRRSNAPASTSAMIRSAGCEATSRAWTSARIASSQQRRGVAMSARRKSAAVHRSPRHRPRARRSKGLRLQRRRDSTARTHAMVRRMPRSHTLSRTGARYCWR